MPRRVAGGKERRREGEPAGAIAADGAVVSLALCQFIGSRSDACA